MPLQVESSEAFIRFLKASDVALMLNCSTRNVYRLRDSGKIPTSVKIGSLVRWHEQVIRNWIADGCKPSRN